ncbi:DMT family transporter [Pseudorhodoferax sp. Leaf274]|uniref:DMT family transporter n=1 Tax=Pseudorhodoferax sp. Leaf274 TaxID=1736318 RepID=UPI00070302EB|nr:DMT family transporter [Pseudorhodoferax sp. Leaf274]KQP49573.1 multidrug DMT transporter permease [Pseudorhodoferax sp. Leaf274]
MQALRKDQLDGLAVGILLACCLVWGAQQVLVKATIAHMPPVLQGALRFVAATLLLMAWCRWRGIALFGRDGSLAAGLAAGLLFFGEFVCLYLGLVHTTASRATVFLYTSPFWVALLLPWWVPSERLRPAQWAGLACAFVAVAFALREGFGAGLGTWRGDLLSLLAALLWGLTTVLIRAAGLTRLAPEKLLFYQLGVCALLFPPLSLALGERWAVQFTPFVVGSLALQTVVGAFVSYLAWMWLLGRYPATRLSAFIFLTPLCALGFGALALHEPLTPSLLGAMALVAAGIWLVNRAPLRR